MTDLKADAAMVHPDCQIVDVTFGAWCEIGRGSRVAHSDIASFVRIGATDHPLDRASLHHFMYRSAAYWPDAQDDADWFAQRRARRVVIGHDTWIGHHAQVKPEVMLGHEAVVASGAVVTRDVPPCAIVAGVPARVIRMRLSDDLAARMITLAWRDWDHARLRDALDDFRALPVAALLARDKAG
ncbi:MAG: chloramphenicol acetyltransferase [Rhodobacterales bacterium]